MNITIIGAGYVGLIAGACFAKANNKVICLDTNESKIAQLKNGVNPIYEPGLEELLSSGIRNHSLSFTLNPREAIMGAEAVFITVGTPQDNDGNANMNYFYEAARTIGRNIEGYTIVIDKSTVPVGTAQRVEEIIQEELKKRNTKIEFDVVSNPEFLAEGSAIKDFYEERVVIGSKSEKALNTIEELYKKSGGEGKKILRTDPKSAEIIKYASNSMLALRLSFINEVSQLCEKVGANIEDVSKGIGMDERIGNKFLKASLGYGGSCFPKDIKAFIRTMKQNGCENGLIDQIESVNDKQMRSAFDKAKKLLPQMKGKRVAILGLAFKANTDDIRESPAIKITKLLEKEGALLQLYDPKAMDNAKSVFSSATFTTNAYDAVKGSELVVIATEWEEFASFDLNRVKKLMSEPNILDGRNIYDPNKMKKMGFNYLSIGR